MIINHNLAANNAIRNMNINTTNASKSMQKLSSGLRINGAADDAAGLAISEKMRGQIRGLDQASANAQDATSLIQTAEGGLNETHSILQRMRELAVQSSTDTNTADDRAKIQAETDQLAKEITRISNTTEFNTQNLLAGGLNDTFQIGANKGQNISLSVSAMDAKSLGVSGDMITYQLDAANAAKISGISNPSKDLNGYKVDTIGAVASTASTAITGGAITQSNASGGALSVTGGSYTGTTDLSLTVKGTFDGSGDLTGAQVSTDGGTSWQTVTVASNKFDYAGLTGITVANSAANKTGDTYSFNVTAGYKNLQLNDGTNPVGSIVKVYSNMNSAVIGNSDTFATVNFDYATLDATGGAATTLTKNTTASTAAQFAVDGSITAEAVTQKGIDVSTQSEANSAIKTIDTAINTVSKERSKLGAYQNRLEHTIANLGTSSENLTSSESRIRDVDMAKEMSNFSKNNILSQAAQAMLAQANAQPQQVLQLLR